MLTQKQEQFCLNILKGMTQHDAYINAGYSSDMLPAVIDVEASRLMDNPKVSLRLNELREESRRGTIMDVIERKEKLTEIARGTHVSAKGNPMLSVNMQAIDLLNKTDGLYSSGVNVNKGTQVINIIVPDETTKEVMSKVKDVFELPESHNDT